MLETRKTLSQILRVPEAETLMALIAAKGRSATLSRLDEPERAMVFAKANLRASYLFARFVVPSYASAVFSSLTSAHPVDDEGGALLGRIMEAMRGELFNNNIFDRPGECHSHFHDAWEGYRQAGGDMHEAHHFMVLVEKYGFRRAIRDSTLWSERSADHAEAMLRCCEDPLALFILMPANEEFTPIVYARALSTLSREGRFDGLRTFLSKHVMLDEGDHGPAALEWLELHLRKTPPEPARLAEAIRKVSAVFGG